MDELSNEGAHSYIDQQNTTPGVLKEDKKFRLEGRRVNSSKSLKGGAYPRYNKNAKKRKSLWGSLIKRKTRSSRGYTPASPSLKAHSRDDRRKKKRR